MGKDFAQHAANEAARLFTFLLVPKFPMLAFSSAIEPLRIANWVAGRTLYDWQVLTVDGAPVDASNGLLLGPHGSISNSTPQILLVGAGVDGCFYENDRVFKWLRMLDRGGATLGAFDTGTWLLARAGVLNGVRCTVHWEDVVAFRASFPGLHVTESLYEVDGRYMTCSGGTATMDLMLSLIAADHGRELAGAIAEQFMQDQLRDGERHQRVNLASREATSDSRLLTAIDLMKKHIEEPLPLEEISRTSGASMRNLERLFRLHMQCSPTHFYREIRLRAARQLLLHGTGSVLDVALATGFVSASHFSRCYRTRYGRPPRVDQVSRRGNGHHPF